MRWARVAGVLGIGVATLVAGLVLGGPGGVGTLIESSPSGAPTVVVVPEAGTAAAGPVLTVATFNICKTDCEAPGPSWDVRRDRVARVIVESGLDVVGIQENTFFPVTHAKTQALDLQNLVAPAGFVAPSQTPDSDECRWTAPGQKACVHSTGLLFNSATVRQVTTPNGSPSAGTVPSSRIADGLTPDAAPRSVSWAYLEGVNGARPFLALSIHLSTNKDPANEASRVAFGAALDGWAQAFDDQHGMSGVPVVLMGDLNSYRKRQPAGVQQVLVNEGWVDSATAPVRHNTEYSTININPFLPANEQGFPVKPYVFHGNKSNPEPDATRIDYVMLKGAQPVDYEVVIHLNPDGSFVPDYQASDHQMVRTVVEFPAA